MSVFGKKAEELKSVFFVLGAPNAAIKHQLKDFHAVNKNMKIVFCSDYNTMNGDQREREGKQSIAKDIHGIPTNCRAHAEPGENSKKTEKNFRLAQSETSRALVYMFEFSRDNSVPLYLASLPRNDRPLNVELNKESTPLTEKILYSVAYPSYGDRRAFEQQLYDHSKYKASYLIDLVTVVMAMLDDNVWYQRDVDVSIGVGNYGPQKSKGELVTLWDEQISGVDYFKMEDHIPGYWYTGPITVNVFNFKDSAAMEKLNEKLNQVADEILRHNSKPCVENSFKPCFENSFVFGDDLLNDVDDIPAKYVVKRYTQRTIETYINFSGVFRKWIVD